MRFEIISTGTLSAKGGAGLGLIELARKSENIILFAVKKIDANFSAITFDIKMDLHESAPRKMKSIENRPITCLKDTILYYKGKIGKKIKHQIQQILSENFTQVDAHQPLKWLEQVTAVFGENLANVSNLSNNKVEMIFKKIHENLDFIANKKILKDNNKTIQNLAQKFNLESNLSLKQLQEDKLLATLSIQA